MISITARPTLVRRWEGRAVVFCADSGDTLFLSELASTVLEVLESGPHDEASLVLRMGDRYENSQEQLATATLQALDELDRLGLTVRRHP